MERHKNSVIFLSHVIHENFLWFVLGSYAIAAVWPAPGVLIRDISFGTMVLLGETVKISLPVVMLGFLLFVSFRQGCMNHPG
ncbi:MAG TPA: hypothetical protein VKU02_06460 [Gemmataceae bacterium]|nr:hypothetical protein [Gemmataceae bacterium]